MGSISKRLLVSLALLSCCVLSTAQSTVIDLSSYNNVYYVSTTGDDTLNTGTAANPFATVDRAISAAASTGDAIFIGGGEFDITNTGANNFGDSGLNNDGKDVDFIGTPNETVFKIDGTATTSRDLHFYSGKGFSRVYGITFVRDSNNRATNYMNAFFGFGTVQGEFYNSVFKSVNSNVIGLTYDNTNTLDVSVFNSVFDVEVDFSSSYSGRNLQLFNSVSNKSFLQSDGNTYNSVLSNVTFDEDYNITSDASFWQDAGVGFDRDGSQADLGVYGSTYSWAAVQVPSPSTLVIVALALFSLSLRSKKAAKAAFPL